MDIRTRITITKVTGESGLGTPFKVNLSKNISGITAEDLKFAVGDAEIYVEEMKKLAADTETNAGKAKNSATDAAKSAQDAADSLAAIGSSVDESAANAAAAKLSADAAKASEDASAEYKDAAAHSAESANSAADMVYQKVEEAKESASNAKTSEVNAKASEDAASKSAADSDTRATAAKASEDAAKLSETAAKGSETAAKASEDAAASSATNAGASEKNSKASEEAANVSAKAAKESEANAATEAVKSATSATESDTSAKTAKVSEDAAKLSELAAAESAKNAATSETNAKGSETAAAESVTQVTAKVTEAETILEDFKGEVVKAETVTKDLAEKLDAGQQIVDATDANAKAAAQSAQESASSAATALEHANTAKTAKTAAESSAAAAKVEADKASNQATAATNQAVNASNSADRANEKAIAAKTSADYADELVGMAKAEVDKAAEQATRAESEADRAKEEADRAAENSAGIQPKQINGFAKYYLEAGAATTDINNRARGEFVRIGGTKTTPQVTINEVVPYVGNANSFKHVESFTPVLSIQGVTANPQTGNIDSLPRATTTAYGTVKTTNTLNATVEVVPTSRPIFLKFEAVDTKLGDVEKSALDATLAAGKASSDLDAFKEEMTIALADKMDKSGEVTVESLYATGNIKGLAISGSSIGVYNGRGKQILLQFDYDTGSVPEIELQQANVSKYRYTFPAKSGKVALLSDIPEIGGPVEVPEASTSVHGTVLLSESISDLASTVPTTKAVFDAVSSKANSSDVYSKTSADETFLKKADAMEEIGQASADKAGIMKLYDDAGTQIDGTLTQKYISSAFGEINGSIQSIREDYDSQISGLMTQYDNLASELSSTSTTAENAMAGVDQLTPKVTNLEKNAVLKSGTGTLDLSTYSTIKTKVISTPTGIELTNGGFLWAAPPDPANQFPGEKTLIPVKLAPTYSSDMSNTGAIAQFEYYDPVTGKEQKRIKIPYIGSRTEVILADRFWCSDQYGEAKNLAQKQTGDINDKVIWKGSHQFKDWALVSNSSGGCRVGLYADGAGSNPLARLSGKSGGMDFNLYIPVGNSLEQNIATREWVQDQAIPMILPYPAITGSEPRQLAWQTNWDFRKLSRAHTNDFTKYPLGVTTGIITMDQVWGNGQMQVMNLTNFRGWRDASGNTSNFQLIVGNGGEIYYRAGTNYTDTMGSAWTFRTEKNTTVDGNGFIKKASPIVEILTDGNFRTNSESDGAYVYRLSEGVYRIDGVLGFNSDPAWGGTDGGIEIPLDNNKNPLVWVDYKVLEDGSIIIKTFHRENPNAPSFARNVKEGYKDGQPIDIPEGRFLSVRVQMPEVVEDEVVVEE